MPRKMKECGVEWLGQIPEGWELRRGKTFLRLLSRIVEDTDDVITCFRDGEVTLRKNRREEGFTNALKECGYQGVEPGDLVVHGMDGFAGAIGISDSRGKASPVLNVMDTDENKRFVMYYLRVMAMCDVFLALSTGIRVRSCDLRWNKLGDLEYLLPPRSEQQRIAAFLDERCAKIDGMIAEAKASVEDYKKWKQSIIFEAVTGKHEKNLKPSGVDWIGDVPEWWKVTPIKYLLTEINHRSEKGTEEPLSMSQQLGIVPSSMINVANPASTFVGAKIVGVGDLVFNKLKAHLGVFAISKYEGLVSPDYAVYRSTEVSDAGYLNYLFHSPNCVEEFKRHITGVGQGLSRLYTSDLFVIKAPLPSLGEQRRIAAYLYEKCAAIDKLVGEKEALIADLEAYKKSLIFETVTGKREVA